MSLKLSPDQARELTPPKKKEDPGAALLVDIKKAMEMQQAVILQTLQEVKDGMANKVNYKFDVKRDKHGLIESIVAVPIELEKPQGGPK